MYHLKQSYAPNIYTPSTIDVTLISHLNRKDDRQTQLCCTLSFSYLCETVPISTTRCQLVAIYE